MTAFSNEFLQDLPPKERRYDTPVGENLVFSVFPNGVKAWVHVYSYEGFVRRRTIGLFPEMDYAQAQAALSQSRRIVAVELQQGGSRQGARGMSRSKLALLTAGAVIGGIAIALIVRTLTDRSSAPETTLPVASVEADAEPAPATSAAASTASDSPMTPMREDALVPSATADADPPPGSESTLPVSADAALATTDQPGASVDGATDAAIEDAAQEVGAPDTDGSGGAESPQTESPTAVAAAADDTPVEAGATDPVAETSGATDDPAPAPETLGTSMGQSVGDAAAASEEDLPDLEGSAGMADQPPDESIDDALEETDAAVDALPGAVIPQQDGDLDEAAPEPGAEPSQEPSDVAPPEQATGSEAEPEPAAPSAPAVRTQLTSGLADMQPTDKLVSPIAIAAGDTRRVYFFTEASAMTGMRVTHRWQREGTTLTQLPFVVAGDPWPIYSSKEILAEQAGEWEVSILDEDGTVLASETFQVSVEAP